MIENANTHSREYSVTITWSTIACVVLSLALIVACYIIYRQQQQLNAINAASQELSTLLEQLGQEDLMDYAPGAQNPAATDDHHAQLADYLRDELRLEIVSSEIEGNYAHVEAMMIGKEGMAQMMFLRFENNQWQELPISSGEPYFPACNRLTEYGVPQSLYGECATCEEIITAWQPSGGAPADIQAEYCQ